MDHDPLKTPITPITETENGNGTKIPFVLEVIIITPQSSSDGRSLDSYQTAGLESTINTSSVARNTLAIWYLGR